MDINLIILIVSILVAWLLYYAITKSMKLIFKIILVLAIAYFIYPYLISLV